MKGEDGAVWFGTERGAIRFDGATWNYRAGRRWLLDDYVAGILVEADGSAWIATETGFSHIKRESWTLEKKSDYFIEQVEARHNRDAFVLEGAEGDGWTEHEGTFFLLPYWMGRYHGFIK